MPLSDIQRAALDSRIDPAALERFLDQFPTEHHAVILNGCLRDPDPDIGGVVESKTRKVTDIRDPLCERCHSRPAVRFELTVFGPLDLRETRLCANCQAAVDAATELRGAEPLGSFAHLGPIDFDVLRASIRRSETGPRADHAALEFVSRELPRIAAAHAQTLPPDIRAFVVRHSK